MYNKSIFSGCRGTFAKEIQEDETAIFSRKYPNRHNLYGEYSCSRTFSGVWWNIRFQLKFDAFSTWTFNIRFGSDYDFPMGIVYFEIVAFF